MSTSHHSVAGQREHDVQVVHGRDVKEEVPWEPGEAAEGDVPTQSTAAHDQQPRNRSRIKRLDEHRHSYGNIQRSPITHTHTHTQGR